MSEDPPADAAPAQPAAAAAASPPKGRGPRAPRPRGEPPREAPKEPPPRVSSLGNPLPPLKRAADDRPPAEDSAGAAAPSAPVVPAAAAPSPRPTRPIPPGPAHYRANNPPRGDRGADASGRMSNGGGDGPRLSGPRGAGGGGGGGKHPQHYQQQQHNQQRPMQGGGGMGNRPMPSPSPVVSTRHSGATESLSTPQQQHQHHQPSTASSSSQPLPLISSTQTPDSRAAAKSDSSAKPTPKIERAAADWGDDEPATEDLEAVTERLRRQLDKTRSENAEFSAKYEKLSKDTKSNVAELAKAKEDLAKATTKVETMEAVQRSLSDSRSKLEDERDALKVQLVKAEREVKALREELTASKNTLAEREAVVSSQQNEIEFLNADFDYKLISERKKMENRLASLLRQLHISRQPHWLYSSDLDREAACNILDFSKLDMVVIDTSKWAAQVGTDQVKFNLADFLQERSVPVMLDAEGSLAQLEPALIGLFAQQPATVVLFVVPSKSPEADATAWSDALSTLVSALARTQSPTSRVAIVIEDASVKLVADKDVFGDGLGAGAPHIVTRLRPKLRSRTDSL